MGIHIHSVLRFTTLLSSSFSIYNGSGIYVNGSGIYVNDSGIYVNENSSTIEV